MTDPMVSVNMITYNHRPYLAEAIEGVLMQETDFPLELVIGEDCSTDGTREIAFDYQRRFPDVVRVVTSEQNVGSRANSYRVRKASRGKYIAFCEGDDYWIDPRKLQKQVDFLESHPDYGLVHTDVQMLFDQTGITTPHAHRVAGAVHDDSDDLFLALALRRYRIWTGTVCARTSLVLHVTESNPEEFQTTRFLMGDLPLWLELSRLCRFEYFDEQTATYRIGAESASKSQVPARSLRFRRSAKDMHLHYLRKYNYPTAAEREVVRMFNEPLLWFAFLAGDVEQARSVIRENEAHGIRNGFKEQCLYAGSRCRIVGAAVNSLIALRTGIGVGARRFAAKRAWCLWLYRQVTGRNPVLRTTGL